MSKILELVVIDQQTEKKVRSYYDAAVIVAVQEFTRAGANGSVCTLATGLMFQVDEPYESLRKRWVQAREQEVLLLTPEKKLTVV